MFIETLLLPLFVGKIRGGQFKNLLELTINKWWLIVLSGLLEFTASFIRAREIEPLWQWVNTYILWIHLLIYALLFIALCFNIKTPGFIWIIIGSFLNFLVIMVNKGRMPVAINHIQQMLSTKSLELLKAGKNLTHVIADSTTNLPFLGDIIYIPRPYPLPKSLSIGDLFLIAGIFILIYKIMMRKQHQIPFPNSEKVL